METRGQTVMGEHSSWQWVAAAEAPAWGFHGPSIQSLVPGVFFKNIKKTFYFEIIASVQKNCKYSCNTYVFCNTIVSSMDSHNTLFPDLPVSNIMLYLCFFSLFI